jgi:hypothetical protein
MNKGIVNSLPVAEYRLVMETEREALAGLDEDQLVALHERVRRARTKYTKNYRREAAAKVPAKGGRGKARPTNTLNRQRAEVFEEALARVSTRLAAAARASAAELRAERIAAARGEAAGPARTTATVPAKGARAPKKAPNPKTGDRDLVNPRSLSKGAASQAKGQRRQAKRDAR